MQLKQFVFVFLIISHFPLFSFDEPVHNQQLNNVLFRPSVFLTEKGKEKLTVLEEALYLTIDLYNGTSYNNGQAQRYLDNLKRFGVRRLPKLENIDFTSNQYHQRYTHRGWDWVDYPSNYQNIWNVRQQLVLLPTIDKIFRFKQEEMIKRDSFAALLYYVHILGDHIGDKKATYSDRIPISPRPDYRFNQSGENQNNPTICTELLYHLSRLFREQTRAPNYSMLMRFLERNKNRVFSTGTTIPDEEYEQLQDFAQETLDNLMRYIPTLLENEDFFRRTFL